MSGSPDSAAPADDIFTRFVTRRGFLLTGISLAGPAAGYGLLAAYTARKKASEEFKKRYAQ